MSMDNRIIEPGKAFIYPDSDLQVEKPEPDPVISKAILEALTDPVTSQDPINRLVDELEEKASEEVVRRARYKLQLTEMLGTIVNLSGIVTCIGETLGVEIDVEGKKERVSHTEVPGYYNTKQFKQIAAHVMTSIHKFKRMVDLKTEEAIQSLKDKEQAEKIAQSLKGDLEKEYLTKISNIETKLKQAVERGNTYKDILEGVIDLPRFILVEKPDPVENKGAKYFVLKPASRGTLSPGMTKFFDKAQVYSSEEEALDDKVKLIREIKNGNIKFSGGLERARKLVIANISISLPEKDYNNPIELENDDA